MDEDIEDSIKWVARGAGILLLGTFISKAIMYLYRVLVARYLGSAEYGTLSLLLAIFWIFVTFSHLSIPGGVNRFVSKFLGRDEPLKIEGTYISAIQIVVPASLLLSAILLFTAPLIAERFFHTQEIPSSDVVLYLRLFALVIPFQILYQVTNAVVTAHKRMEFEVLTDKIYRSLATLLVTVGLILAGYGILGAIVGQLFAIITASLLIVFLTQRYVFPVLTKRAEGFRNREELFHYSYPLMLSGIIGLVVGWTDTLMLGWFDTTSQVGIYNAALPTAQLLTVVGSAFSAILFPVVASMYAEGKKEKSIDVTATTVKWMFALSFPFMLLLILFSRPALGLLFGREFESGSIALSVLAVAFFTRTMISYAPTFIKSEDRTKLVLLNTSITAALNFFLNLALIPRYGTAGAGIATALSLAFGGILFAVEAKRLFGVQPFRVKKLLPVFVATVLSTLSIYAVVKYFYDPTPYWVMIPALVVFVLMYGLLFLLLGGLGEDDILILNSLEEKAGVDLSRLKEVVKKVAR